MLDERDARVAALAYEELLARAARERLASRARPTRSPRSPTATGPGRILVWAGRQLAMIAGGRPRAAMPSDRRLPGVTVNRTAAHGNPQRGHRHAH